jgi:ABC-2 type transport system ATP-binding protein
VSRVLVRVPIIGLVVVLATFGLGATVEPARADEHTHTRYDETIESFDGTEIHATVYRPAGASPADPVPMILHSHGWSGSRTSSPDAFQQELDRGFGVLSFDQRGHGETEGPAGVQDPEREGRDVIAVLDHVASLDWVLEDPVDSDDPVVFAMGISYGGGFQLVGALTELRETGRTRFNALAPEITWFDLSESLAPQKVVRTAWAAALYAAGLDAHEDDIHLALGYSAATGEWPDGSQPGIPDLDTRFWRNGPVAFIEADGLQLDIPVLIGQGATDNLFNLNQGWKNFERTLTPQAQQRSIFIGYNGGHALPSALPPGHPIEVEIGTNEDACSPGGFAELRLDFFDAVAEGADPRGLVEDGLPYHLTTADEDCVHTDRLDDRVPFEIDTELVIPTGTGPPQHVELAEGPITVAGVPLLEALVTTVGFDQRAFFALSVGATPADARIVQNNMMPLREEEPVEEQQRTIELPGIAIEVPEGENLYLTASPVSDASFGHGSTRSPGLIVLEDAVVHVPVLGDTDGGEPGPGEGDPDQQREGGPAPGDDRSRGAPAGTAQEVSAAPSTAALPTTGSTSAIPAAFMLATALALHGSAGRPRPNGRRT